MPPPGALASDLVEVRGELLGMDSAYVGLTQVLDAEVADYIERDSCRGTARPKRSLVAF